MRETEPHKRQPATCRLLVVARYIPNSSHRDSLELEPHDEFTKPCVVDGSVSFETFLEDDLDFLAGMQRDQRDLCPIRVLLAVEESHYRRVDVMPRHILWSRHPSIHERATRLEGISWNPGGVRESDLTAPATFESCLMHLYRL